MEKLREEFVFAAQSTKNFSALCREFGISRQIGYKWVDRYNKGLPLSDLSRQPKSIANKTSEDVEKLILDVRYDNPDWGARTIKKVLENSGYTNIPCEKLLTIS